MEVPADKELPVRFLLTAEKLGDDGRRLSGLQGLIRAVPVGEAVLQLMQRNLHLVSPPLGRPGPTPPVQGEVAGKLSKKGGQNVGPLGRHGVPGVEPGVVDALLRVLLLLQNPPGYGVTVGPILLLAGRNGLLRPGPIEVDDLAVLHRKPSFLVFFFILMDIGAQYNPAHPHRRKKAPEVAPPAL